MVDETKPDEKDKPRVRSVLLEEESEFAIYDIKIQGAWVVSDTYVEPDDNE